MNVVVHADEGFAHGGDAPERRGQHFELRIGRDEPVTAGVARPGEQHTLGVGREFGELGEVADGNGGWVCGFGGLHDEGIVAWVEGEGYSRRGA